MRTRGIRGLAAGMLFAVLIGAFAATPATAAQVAHSSYSVYFPVYTITGGFLYPVRYLVPVTMTPAGDAMKALIAGPPSGTGVRFVAIPKDTKATVSHSGGVWTVDFSEEIRKVNVGSGGEAALISSIVATLGQFAGQEPIRILVSGQPVETLAGHVDVSDLLYTRDTPTFKAMDDVYQHWSGGAVSVLQAMDVIAGYPDGTFKPDNKVTRAEFIKMLIEGLNLPYASSQAVPFKDVPGQWHEAYIQRALAAGLIKASDYGEYLKPDEVIPREEMASLLVTASAAYLKQHPEVQHQSVSPAPVFSDSTSIAEKYRASVQESARLGLLLGNPDGTFRPKDGLTRGEAATVITRVLGMAASKDIVSLGPLRGAKWDGGSLDVFGAAEASEGTVNWRITGPTGDVMYSYTTASMGMGWGLFGLHVDSALFADKSPTSLELFLVSMKDGSNFSKVLFPLVK